MGAGLLSWALLSQAQQRNPPSEVQKAVEEFRVQARALGLTGDGSSQQVKTARSSRGRWHGRLFHNFRNDFLDATPHEVAQRGGEKNILRRNQFGVNVSGPVVIPKLYDGGRATFFTFTYEGMREKIGRSSLRTIPRLEERSGDWSGTVDNAGVLLPIYDPGTTSPNPAYNPAQDVSTENLQYNRLPFPDNRIPTARLDSVARNALSYYPAPNSNAGPFFRNNYFVFTPEVNSANGVITRVDHTAGSRHRIGFGMSLSNGQDGAPALFPTLANPGNAIRSRRSRRGTLEHVFTVSPTRLNTLTFEVSSDRIQNKPETDGSGRVFPQYLFSPYLSMGRSTPNLRSARNTFALVNGHSIRKENHRVRLVGQVIREQVNIFAPQYPEGSYRFSAGLTSLPGIVNTGHAFASFLLGLSNYAEQTVTVSPSYFRKSRYITSISDNWEVRKGLTLSFSFGLDMNAPRTEKYNRLSTVSLSEINPVNGRPGALVVAGRNGRGRSFQPFLVKGEPSLGVAWNILGRTGSVLRASYSRSYSPIPIYSAQWSTQAFNGAPTWVSANPQLAPAVILAQGLPGASRVFPDLRAEAANNTIADLMEPTGRQPTYQSAAVSVEHALPAALVMTLGFGHSNGRNLLLNASNPNAIPLDALDYRDRLNDENFNRSLRPYPQYQRFDVYSAWPEGRYWRSAAYVRAEKRLSQGLSFSAYYEVSKQMDNYSGPYGVQDYYNRQNEWSLTAGNNPQRLTMTYNYELPFGPNRPFLTVSDWRRYLVDGWSVSGSTTMVSGEPVALRPMFNNTGGVVDALRVNVVPGVDPHVADRGPDLWFNPAAFAQPADFTIGDASRTHPSLRMPSSQNHDLSVNKRISLTAEKSVEFSMVGLNFVNHANWSDPDTLIGTETSPNVNAGKIIGSRGGRVIQLGLRFSF